MMKAPPPSLESYLQSIKGSGPPGPGPTPGPSQSGPNPAQQELEKMKQLQHKKQEIEHHLSMINNQILKCQGALEILQNLGIRP